MHANTHIVCVCMQMYIYGLTYACLHMHAHQCKLVHTQIPILTCINTHTKDKQEHYFYI